MAHHIESRVPFLDTPFATYAMRLPDAAKIHGVMRKRILRQTMAGRLPDSIRLNLVKKGFPVPQVAWLGACEPYIRETLESAEFRKRPYWDAAQTLTWLQGRNFHRRQHQLWRLWSTELWIRTFLDQDVPKPTRL